MTDRALTPPQYAARLGVKAAKVVAWINSGELRAVNVASSLGGRPRWKIPLDAIVEFQNRRAAKPVTKPSRRRKPATDVIQYF